MVSLTAANILAYNNTSSNDCSAINTEAVTDIAIDFINLETGGSVQAFRDVSFPYVGTSTLTLTASQYPVVMAGAALMLRAFTDQGPNATVAGLNVTSIISDPHYQVYTKLFKLGIDRLRGRSFVRT